MPYSDWGLKSARRFFNLSVDSLYAVMQLEPAKIKRFAALLAAANRSTQFELDDAGPALVVMVDEALANNSSATTKGIAKHLQEDGFATSPRLEQIVETVRNVAIALEARHSREIGL